jgi:hypothetical protein
MDVMEYVLLYYSTAMPVRGSRADATISGLCYRRPAALIASVKFEAAFDFPANTDCR